MASYRLSKDERILKISGVPIRCLQRKINPKQFNFETVSLQNANKSVISVDPITQEKFFKNFLSNIDKIGSSAVYAIGSFPTEQSSYELATFLTKEYYKYSMSAQTVPNIKWMNLGAPDWEFLRSENEVDLFVLHGLSDNSENKRLELCKDFLHKADVSTVLLLATTSDILKFCIYKLETNPDGIWQMGKNTHRTFT